MAKPRVLQLSTQDIANFNPHEQPVMKKVQHNASIQLMGTEAPELVLKYVRRNLFTRYSLAIEGAVFAVFATVVAHLGGKGIGAPQHVVLWPSVLAEFTITRGNEPATRIQVSITSADERARDLVFKYNDPVVDGMTLHVIARVLHSWEFPSP